MARNTGPRALVIDGDAVSGTLLCAQLGLAGYATELVGTSEEAAHAFRRDAFDVVLLDMDIGGSGVLESARHIKAISAESFTPVLVVADATEMVSVPAAIEAGADDFVLLPVDLGVLSAKLTAMTRMRDLNRRARLLYERVLVDQELAREVFDRVVSTGAPPVEGLSSRLVPAEVFSGDILLAARSPGGVLHILFGDFTGHGLAAALGAIPVASVLRAMAFKDLPGATVLAEINRKLNDVMPRGSFLAALYIEVSPDARRLKVANCAMPALRVCNGERIRQRLPSGHYSLGIVRELDFSDAFVDVAVDAGDTLVMVSDGVAEAVDADGGLFGEARLEAIAVSALRAGRDIPAAVLEALRTYRGPVPLNDDVSIASLRLEEAAVPPHTAFDGGSAAVGG